MKLKHFTTTHKPREKGAKRDRGAAQKNRARLPLGRPVKTVATPKTPKLTPRGPNTRVCPEQVARTRVYLCSIQLSSWNSRGPEDYCIGYMQQGHTSTRKVGGGVVSPEALGQPLRFGTVQCAPRGATRKSVDPPSRLRYKGYRVPMARGCISLGTLLCLYNMR